MGKSNSRALEPSGALYKMLDSRTNRASTAIAITCFMLVVATCLSFVIPMTYAVIALFVPGVVTFLFGGMLPKRHWAYNLNTNQRLAIHWYRQADPETQKLFPEEWEETVRNAKGLGPGEDGTGSDTWKLAKAAERIVKAARERNEAMQMGDDKVIVALTVLEQNTELLESDTMDRKKIEQPKTIKRMVGRKVVEEPWPIRKQDR